MSRISHKYKFIFFSYPKTGSSTVRDLLNPYSDIIATTYTKRTKENPFYSHITALETKKLFEERGWDFDSYHKFVFIRNPFSRLVSLYNMSFKKVPFNVFISKLQTNGTAGLSNKQQHQKWKVHGLYNLLNFAGDGNNLLVNDVIKLGNINREIPELFKKLGIPVPSSIPKINVGKYPNAKKNWKSYYSRETKKIVGKLYKWEIKQYNYNF